MKNFLLITIGFFHSLCICQTNVKSILDSVLVSSKQTSMYTSLVEWESLEKNVFSKAENAKTISELAPAFTELLNGIRDKHGKIINAKNYQTIASFTAFDKLNSKDNRERDANIWSIVNDTASHYKYKIIDENIGYLKIVGIAPNVNIEKESRKIRNSIIELSNKGIEHWIIDLRYNGGGNMYPMVSGIAPLIGDGEVGSLVNLKGEKIFNWQIKKGNFIYGGYEAVNIPNNLTFKKLPKIAVLTSRWTVSSGEIVATCLKGRDNTRFFGEATGGYTTNNSWENVNDEVIVIISTGIFCDRNGNPYPFNIPVDEEVLFEVTTDSEKDTCISKAISWLKE